MASSALAAQREAVARGDEMSERLRMQGWPIVAGIGLGDDALPLDAGSSHAALRSAVGLR